MSHGTGRFTPDWDSKLFLLPNSVTRCVPLSKTNAGGASIRPAASSCEDGVRSGINRGRSSAPLSKAALSRTIAENMSVNVFVRTDASSDQREPDADFAALAAATVTSSRAFLGSATATATAHFQTGTRGSRGPRAVIRFADWKSGVFDHVGSAGPPDRERVDDTSWTPVLPNKM